MSAENRLNVPPIVEQLAGEDPLQLAAAAMAFEILRQVSCGRNGEMKRQIDDLVEKHPWLIKPPTEGEPTPLVLIRRDIEANRQELLALGRDPCPDFNLN